MARSLRHSLLITLSKSYVILGLQFIASLVIARLLTPNELGVFSVAMVLISLMHTIRDFGVVNYVIQEKDITPDRIRAASAITFLVAWALALIVLLGADEAANFYKEPGVAEVMRILSINFWLLPFGSISMACMRREMMFERIAIIHLTSAFVQAGLSILLAWLGWRYLSLAWAAVTATLVQMVMIWFMRPKWVPFLPGLSEIKRVLRFSSLSTTTEIIREGAKGAPDLILGRLLGMEAVAFFSRANGLVDMFNRMIVEAVAYVVLPHFSAKSREGEDVGKHFLSGATRLTGLSWPFFAWLAITAQPVVLLLYGVQWGESVILVQFFCIGEIFLAPFQLLPYLFIAQGRIGLELTRTAITMVIRVLPLILLPPYGLEVTAAGYAISSIAVAAISLSMITRYQGISMRDFFRALKPSIGVLAMVVLVLQGGALVLPMALTSGWTGMGVHFCMAVLATLLGFHIMRHPMKMELTHIVQMVRRRIA